MAPFAHALRASAPEARISFKQKVKVLQAFPLPALECLRKGPSSRGPDVVQSEVQVGQPPRRQPCLRKGLRSGGLNIIAAEAQALEGRGGTRPPCVRKGLSACGAKSVFAEIQDSQGLERSSHASARVPARAGSMPLPARVYRIVKLFAVAHEYGCAQIISLKYGCARNATIDGMF